MDSWIDLYNIFAGFVEGFYTDFFFWVLNTSISASFLVVTIIILRLILKKAPKAMIVAIWGMLAIRLICPFSFESALSLIPSEETIPTEQFQYQETRHDDYNLHIVSNPIYPEEINYTMPGDVESNSWDSMYAYLGWLGGMGIMLVYSATSYIIIKRKVRVFAPYKDNILLCDGIKTPFILGVFKPKIYLPSDIPDEEKEYVIAHENAHLKRRDHWWKPLGFVLLSFHWFNPLMWVAYILLCRDIEFACDEKVIKSLGEEGKKPYSEALLNCSVPRKMITACPVAFGETGVKSRIKSVLNYKKPAFWVILVSLIACIAVAIGFLTNPIKKFSSDNIKVGKSHSSVEGLSLEITDADFSDFAPYIEIKWINESDKDFVFGDYYNFERDVDGEWASCNMHNSDIYNSLEYKLDSGKTFTKRYEIAQQDMSKSGTYRFESYCSEKDVEANKDYEVSITFDIKEGKVFPTAHYFRVADYVYDDGSYSYSGPNAEDIGVFRIRSGMYMHKHNGFEWQELGDIEEITLNEDNFDSRFRNVHSWFNGINAQKLKNENKRAWQLYAIDSSINPLYILLEQKNGDFYLCYGYHNDKGLVDPNSDSSHIRWIYKLKSADPIDEYMNIAKWVSHGWFVSYAGYTTDIGFYSGAVNSDKLYSNAIQHLPVYKIDTVEDLTDFKNKFSDIFNFSHVYENQFSFNRIANHIDFNEESLFVIYVTAPSLQYEFSVDSVTVNNGELMISVFSNAVETGDTAMAGNFVLVNINKKDIKECTSFDAVFNDVYFNRMHLESAVETAISRKNSESILKGEYNCAAFEILKSETLSDESQNHKIKLYLTTCYASYSTKKNELETMGLISEPAVMTLVQDTDGTFSLVEYYVPIKGDNSDESKKLYELSFAHEGKNLSEICLMKAQKHLGAKAKTEEPQLNTENAKPITELRLEDVLSKEISYVEVNSSTRLLREQEPIRVTEEQKEKILSYISDIRYSEAVDYQTMYGSNYIVKLNYADGSSVEIVFMDKYFYIYSSDEQSIYYADETDNSISLSYYIVDLIS